MAQIIHRCDLCSSEILAQASSPAPHVCLLCQLSAEEALCALDEQEVTYATATGMLHPAGGRGRAVRLA